jgi:hypothetical protein
LALPILQYVSEIWTLKQKNKKLFTSLDGKVFRTAGFALFDTKKKKFLEEFEVQLVDEKLRRHKFL